MHERRLTASPLERAPALLASITFIRFVALAFAFAVIVAAAAAPARAQDEEIARRLDAYLTARAELGRFSGAVLVARGGRVLLRKGYGFADVGRRIPYTAETQHSVASISKMFVSMAALKLRERGRLRLEDSICKYLDDCPAAWQPVTVQHLMRHTSGIPDYEEKLELASDKYIEFMTRPGATARIVSDARRLPLDFKPGEKFHYSNTGYILLSYVVERAARKPFADFVEEAVLRPAGMRDSGWLGSRRAPRRLAVGYMQGNLGWEKTLAGVELTAGHLRPIPPLAFVPLAGDAALYTTLDDLHRWSLAMDGGKVVPAPLAAEVFTPGLDGYGYGWFIDKSFDRRRARHSGGLPGYVSNFVKLPEDKITIIIFSNIYEARLGTMTRDLTAITLGRPYDLPVRGRVTSLTPEQFAALEGEYRMTDGSVLTVRKEPDYLTASIKGRYTAGLIPLSPTEFYFPLADGRALFTLDASGRAARVNMRYNGEDHLGERAAPQP